MPRVSPHDVAEVLETDLDDASLSAFVSDASRIVDQRCDPHADDTDADALADVEAHLAAHLATAKDPRIGSASHESVDVDLEVDPDQYWRTAVALDPTGRLAHPPHGYPIATTTEGS